VFGCTRLLIRLVRLALHLILRRHPATKYSLRYSPARDQTTPPKKINDNDPQST
jgi:hypothetical protein